MIENRYSLRALALLMGYPDVQLRSHLTELMDAIDKESVISAQRREELHAFVTELCQQDPLEAEARYVETFDRGRATSLHMFEHIHGDSRERGPAMVNLLQTYEKSGLKMLPEELPDHLCVVLEFASTQPPPLATEFLVEMAHIITAIFSALVQRSSPYAVPLAAVLEICGQTIQAVAIVADESMDEVWEEPAVFDGCATRGQSKPQEVKPIHFIHKSANSLNSGLEVNTTKSIFAKDLHPQGIRI